MEKTKGKNTGKIFFRKYTHINRNKNSKIKIKNAKILFIVTGIVAPYIQLHI